MISGEEAIKIAFSDFDKKVMVGVGGAFSGSQQSETAYEATVAQQPLERGNADASVEYQTLRMSLGMGSGLERLLSASGLYSLSLFILAWWMGLRSRSAPAAGVARAGQACFPGSTTTSTRTNHAHLSWCGIRAGLATGWQQLIEQVAATVLSAEPWANRGAARLPQR